MMEEGTIRLILLCMSILILFTIWRHGRKQKKQLQGIDVAQVQQNDDDGQKDFQNDPVSENEVYEESSSQEVSHPRCHNELIEPTAPAPALEPETTVIPPLEQVVEQAEQLDGVVFQPEEEVAVESEVDVVTPICEEPIQDTTPVEVAPTVDESTELKKDESDLNIFSPEEKECMGQMFSVPVTKEAKEEVPEPVVQTAKEVETVPSKKNIAEAYAVSNDQVESAESERSKTPGNFVLNTKQLANELSSIYIMAPQGDVFGGYDLLQTVLSNGFVYGDMQVFHHFEGNGTARSGKKLYSLVSATEPGDFDLSKMGSFECKGLILFMNPNDHENAQPVFDSMLTLAHRLADELDGELRADHTQPLTDQFIASMRDKLVVV